MFRVQGLELHRVHERAQGLGFSLPAYQVSPWTSSPPQSEASTTQLLLAGIKSSKCSTKGAREYPLPCVGRHAISYSICSEAANDYPIVLLHWGIFLRVAGGVFVSRARDSFLVISFLSSEVESFFCSPGKPCQLLYVNSTSKMCCEYAHRLGVSQPNLHIPKP